MVESREEKHPLIVPAFVLEAIFYLLALMVRDSTVEGTFNEVNWPLSIYQSLLSLSQPHLTVHQIVN